MKIILDAMGGDNAPDAVVRGALEAAKEFGVQIWSAAARISLPA